MVTITKFVLPFYNYEIQSISRINETQYLYNLTDVLPFVFQCTNCNAMMLRKKIDYYKNLLEGFDTYSINIAVNNVTNTFIYLHSIEYIISDLILHQFLLPNEITIKSLLLSLKNRDLELACITTKDKKIVRNINNSVLPPSNNLFYEEPIRRKNYLHDQKIEFFEKDCQRLQFTNIDDRHWYSELLVALSKILPDVNKLIEREIEIQSSRLNFNYRELNLQNDYRSNVSWAIKLILEKSTADKTKSKNSTVKLNHDLKKCSQRYFLLQLMFHIRNNTYASPFTMNLSDIFYIRHNDIKYSFNLMSHLGVTQSLPTVRSRQNLTASNRNISFEITQCEPCSWTYIYDNFNKTHGSHSSLYGDNQTKSIELINRACLALPATENCTDNRCKNGCIETCYWNKDRPSETISFNEIYLSNKETDEKEIYQLKRIKFFINETTLIHDKLKELLQLSEHNDVIFKNTESNEATDVTESEATDVSESQNISNFEEQVLSKDITTSLKKRDKIRKLSTSNIKNENNSRRIILPGVSGKDTDPYVSYEILNDSLKMFLKNKPKEDRIFIGGDQKTMGLALRLKKQSNQFHQIYVTIPDLHFRKSLMHAILSHFEDLGLRHLAKLTGYANQNQWDYLKNVSSIHKAFEFMERISECLRMSLSFEFLEHLKTLNVDLSNITTIIPDTKLSSLYHSFLLKRRSDKVFQKNLDLLELTELIVMHHAAERTRNWDLRMSVIKSMLHFSMISNCTQYGPLLIELLFHHRTFQDRYQALMQDGYFTFKLRECETSAFVGNDAVIEDVNLLSGQFRHKRQSIDQAIVQSNSVDIIQKQQENLDKNLNIKNGRFEKVFKDDRETKLRIIRAMLHFNSFKSLNRDLYNEFDTEKKLCNEEILLKNNFQIADFLIRRYVQQNPTLKLCNIESSNYLPTVLNEISSTLLTKTRKKTSVVIKIKSSLPTHKSKVDSSNIDIKRKAKQIMNQLLWEKSPFEDAAAICNVDGSKLTTNKSKFKIALRKHLSNEDLRNKSNNNAQETSCFNDIDWLSDIQIFTIIDTIKSKDTENYSIMYPLTIPVLNQIFESNSKTLHNIVHNNFSSIIPLNTGAHWVTLLISGTNQRIYYIDSYGHQPNQQLVKILKKHLVNWKIEHNESRLQYDTYQCGIWCIFFTSIFIQYLENIKNNTNFMNYFKMKLHANQISVILTSNNDQQQTFIRNLRQTYKEIYEKTLTNVISQNIEKPNQQKQNFKFFYDEFPCKIDFKVISVDSQHSLWNNPNVTNGIDYIKFLGKRFFDKYLINYGADTLYWNYDLQGVVKTSVPKCAEQNKRDIKADQNIQYSDNRLIGNTTIISDIHIVKDWTDITNDRNNRNKVAQYVGGNSHHYNVPLNKTLIINSEATKSDKSVIPQMYINNNNKTIKLNMHDNLNRFGEGEGAAVGQLCCKENTINENSLIVSNDSDSILYCLLAGNSRKRNNNKFQTELWLELVYTSAKTGLTGTKSKIVSEFWNINELIYAIESYLPDINNPVESITILYLTAGSDFTEKWFGKTHEHFLKSYIKHSDFIGNLYDNKNSCMINCHSYRKLIHCVWLSDKSDPSQTTFSSLREITKKRKNIRQHLPDEHILLQHYRRVCGVYKYMQSYIVPEIELVDWSKYGFYFDQRTKQYYPKIFMDEIQSEIKKQKNFIVESSKPKKLSSYKTKEQVGQLEKEFLQCNHIDTKRVTSLITNTGLTKQQIQRWFTRKRKLESNADKENEPIIKSGMRC